MSVSKLMLGTVQFGLDYGINNHAGKVRVDEVASILKFAKENKLSYLDSAEAYGNAHEVIGKTISNDQNFNIVSKYSASVVSLPDTMDERIEVILKDLNSTSLYGYLFHSYSQFRTIEKGKLKELEKQKEEGKIKKIGVSVYTNEELEELIHNAFVELVQIPFNMLDNASKRKEIMEKAKTNGIEIHTRSTFLQGLFFMNLDDLTGNLKGLRPYLELLNNLASEQELSMNELALQYALSKPYIDRVLIGVDSLDQLKSNIRAANSNIDKGLLEKIDDIRVQEVELLNPANWKK
ncbi:MAG: aldo/keto reductase [Crocinitomicaceae bacterium]|nr:aldo/keto reductase [Crocinitomicaceae bacterium]